MPHNHHHHHHRPIDGNVFDHSAHRNCSLFPVDGVVELRSSQASRWLPSLRLSPTGVSLSATAGKNVRIAGGAWSDGLMPFVFPFFFAASLIAPSKDAKVVWTPPSSNPFGKPPKGYEFSTRCPRCARIHHNSLSQEQSLTTNSIPGAIAATRIATAPTLAYSALKLVLPSPGTATSKSSASPCPTTSSIPQRIAM